MNSLKTYTNLKDTGLCWGPDLHTARPGKGIPEFLALQRRRVTQTASPLGAGAVLSVLHSQDPV